MSNLYSFSGLSIQKRLPLLICILLLSVVIAFSYTSYVGVKGAALATGTERLHALTGQVSAMFQQYGDATLTAAAHTGSQPAITAFIKSGQKDSLLAAQGILDGVTADTLIPLVEVYDARQVKILSSHT